MSHFKIIGGLSETFGGGKQNEELPNIKGSFWSAGTLSDSENSFTGDEVQYKYASGGSASIRKALFNASLNNSTYKDNGHVTPENYTVRIWRRTA